MDALSGESYPWSPTLQRLAQCKPLYSGVLIMYESYKDIFRGLRQMQNQLWKDYLTNPPGFTLSKDLDRWAQQTFKQMTHWAEQSIKQSFELQRGWLDQWSERVGDSKLKPKLFAQLSDEAQESMQRWLGYQNQLWDQLLDLVRESGDPDSREGLREWQNTMQESLDRQMNLMQEWADSKTFEKMSRKELTKISDQIEKSIESWIEAQQQLWDHWFQTLSQAGGFKAVAKAGEKKKSQTKSAREKATQAQRKTGRTPVPKDDLKLISGIGPSLEKKLNQQGISTFTQLANLRDKDIDSLEKTIIRFPGRIKREKWVEQAKELTSEG